MIVGKELIKKADTWTIIDELNKVEEELYDRMFPPSYSYSKKLSEYRLILKEELASRGIKL